MDLPLQLQVIAGLIVFIFLYNLLIARVKIKHGKEAPEPAGGWPVIGHLPLLRGQEPLFRTLGAMADNYGPAFTLRLGMHRTLVISSWEVAKECFTINDKALSTRPSSAAGKYMGYNNAMVGFAPYGPYWRELRKIITLNLLSNHQIEMHRHVQSTEISNSIKELYGVWAKNPGHPTKVEMKQWFGDLSFNIIVKMVLGKRYLSSVCTSDDGEARRFCNAVTKFFNLLRVTVASDLIPFVQWLDVGGHLSAMKSNAREIDALLTHLLEEHRLKRASGEVDGEHDFMDVMLSIVDEAQLNAQLSSYDQDTIIKATSLALVLGGSDTTSVSMAWALSLLLDHPHALKKVQEELDKHVGRERQVEESNIKNLVYLQAIVKETFRLCPAAPLSIPRKFIEDCHIGGFFIPAGTRLLVNAWKIQQDPRVWSDPSQFRPERFIDEHSAVDVRGQHFECIPFGSGRRSCPGISFSLQVTHLTLARLLHSFDVAAPSDAPSNLGSFGQTSHKSPIDVFLTPRLAPKLYEK